MAAKVFRILVVCMLVAPAAACSTADFGPAPLVDPKKYDMQYLVPVGPIVPLGVVMV